MTTALRQIKPGAGRLSGQGGDTAIDDQLGAGDEAGPVGQQETAGLGHIRDPSDPPQRNGRGGGVATVGGLLPARLHRAFGRPGQKAVGAYAIGGMLDGNGFGQRDHPGLAGLIIKLKGCDLNYQIAGLAIDVMGELGALYGDSDYLRAAGTWQSRFMYDLGLIIGGGTAQIQKNVIAERGLGMPREPKAQS